MQVSVRGKHSISKLKTLFGEKDSTKLPNTGATKLGLREPSSKKESLRSFYGIDRVDNGFYVSETVQDAITDLTVLFDCKNRQDQSYEVVAKDLSAQKDMTAVGKIMMSNQQELALVVVSPTLVQNNDFVYILDEFYRQKFNICAFKKTSLSKLSLDSLFGDLVPKTHTMSVLEGEFNKGDSFLMVLEKSRAVEEAQEVIGKFGIKLNSDWEKKKSTKLKGFSFMNQFGDEQGLITQYGSYIFSFPGVDLNRKKIAQEFSTLPASAHFKMRPVK